MPVQNASSSHPPLVAMVITAEPGFHLASPARAERPLTCPRGPLGSKAGLPGVVTQRRLGRGRQGGTDMAELEGDSGAPGHAPCVSRRGRKDGGDRETKMASRPGRRVRGG